MNKETESNNDVPRRNDLSKMVPAEAAISNAMHEVEKIGASTLLTNAVCMLEKAKGLVSDHIDGISDKVEMPDVILFPNGIELINAERINQVVKHGRNDAYDAEHNKSFQLVSAIMFLGASIGFNTANIEMPREAFNDLKPDGWDNDACIKMINEDYITQLKMIGAFAAAEIDRVQFEKFNKA